MKLYLIPASNTYLFFFCLFLSFSFGLSLAGQSSKISLGIEDYDNWKQIENEQISANGDFVVYHEVPGKGDQVLKIVASDGQEWLSHGRAEESQISEDSRFVAFMIKPHLDSIRSLQRLKTSKDEMPKDSLGIFNIQSKKLIKISDVKTYTVPEEWNGYVVYLMDKLVVSDTLKSDSLINKSKSKKKVSDDNGYHLVIRNIDKATEDTIHFVKSYSLAKSGPYMIYHSTGLDSTREEGVHHYSFTSGDKKPLATGKYQYEKLAISEDGTQTAFLVDTSDKKSYYTSYALKYWNVGMENSKDAVAPDDIEKGWLINHHQEVKFSGNGSKLFFNTSPKPILKDTTLLEDEIIQVEIWSYKDQRLHPQQSVELEKDEKKGFLAVYQPRNDKFIQLGNQKVPEITFGRDKDLNHRFAFGQNSENYMKYVSWQGFPVGRDIYLIDQHSGQSTLVAQGVRGSGDLSPGGNYLYWYNVRDTAYYVYNINQRVLSNVSKAIPTSIVDELDDHPDFPSPYGIGGWTKDDKAILIYDRFDIWKVDLQNPAAAVNLTKGRQQKNRSRLRHLDPDRPYTDFANDIIHIFNETSRSEAYGTLDSERQLSVLLKGDFRLRDISKAKESNAVIYTAQNNVQFGDLQFTNMQFTSPRIVSSVNPQQTGKKWSRVEMINWTSLDGKRLEGLLYKPEDFDASRKYPMIVYFYERNSDNIHRYWGAYPHRSIINPNYYASRGYLVFIPDIVYRDGYPGPSCYNAVIPGVTHLIDKGYVDVKRIGMQGHSWGGYQTAYLATRTDLFACAESGAPVANMISAYGGIRWGTGLSRMFQYEKTQSRLGGTLWEYPMRYFENSPIFFVDKINTPMLIMHNDHDTAVPWYQGIEFFVALRRLNKPAWMLNYNDEPHWPTKRENIVDFNIRMQQYFDHFLMDQNMPLWMGKGIPAVEKGYNKGYQKMD